MNIWEIKGDNKLHLVGKDMIFERGINKGKQRVFLLKKRKVEVLPPPWECTFRLGNKDYVDYIRILDDYIPLKRDIDLQFAKEETKKGFFTRVREMTKKSKKLPVKEMEDNFIYVPLYGLIHGEMRFKPIEYDVNMMRINALDNRDKIYADKMDFLQKYGTFIAIGMIILLIIVVLYLSYEYSGNVISAAMGKAQSTLDMVSVLADKLGGTPPPA